ncbi:class I SAM-dependent methyltransferase [Methanobacterium alcaliphilum]|uniref:class I SAM-dependent methyltransferase n=1 Tax=Methanobacterium alcaliphilum TaxID=392018 RepID=UPI00200B8AF9|nr:class I SAM-dependent methyltransferase [Methanobacterium alcaliphilum]MCK9151385.1 class I SAM-dependent methyltransferase [Methanobacterium alcaliphilum]
MFNNFMLKLLNREASSSQNKPLEILKNLNLQQGMIIGDIGSGGGYFTSLFSKKVGEDGKVYSIDVNQKSLDFIKNELEKTGITNVELVKGNSNGINLPESSVDLFFMRNVFHHLENQINYFKNLKTLLKEDGKVAIIDYDQRNFSPMGIFGHYTHENDLMDVMTRAGYLKFEKFVFLPKQSFMIFKKS